MSEKLEFTCTAMRRPEIVRETILSFAHNLNGVNLGLCRLYLNIDPAPGFGSVDEVISIAREFFGDCIINQPTEANFSAAVKWCWSQPGGEFFFHLEDDWNLRQPVNVGDMLAMFNGDPALSLVNLRAYPHNDDRLCLAPGLWRTQHAHAIAEKMRPDANPEMQLRRKRDNNPHGGLHEGYKGTQFPKEIVLKDIGRPFMKAVGARRNGDRHFVRWT